jgi:hypothetical protein
VRDRETAGEERALQVHVDRAVPLLLGHLGGETLDPDAGAVDEHVQSAVPLDGLGDHPLAVRHDRDVGLHRVECPSELGQGLRGSVGEDDRVASGGEPLPGRATDPAGAARDQHDPRHDVPSGSAAPVMKAPVINAASPPIASLRPHLGSKVETIADAIAQPAPSAPNVR